jgi:methanogenic corrinoid protein MtbC1
MYFPWQGQALEEPENSLDGKTHDLGPPQHRGDRRRVPRPAIEALASGVVRRLACTAPPTARVDDVAVRTDMLEAFCAALVRPTPSAARQFIADRRAEGVTREALYLGYICGAARVLGEAWDENRLTFMEVTIGAGHLHDVMRSLRAEGPSIRFAFDARRSALFATVPGEDHSIGIAVAADMFRGAGWDIDLRTSTDHDGLIAHVDRTTPSIIGLSFSTERRLNDLARLVAAMREVVPLAVIAVAPGAALEEEDIRALVDIDFLFRDARSACVELERLIRLRG